MPPAADTESLILNAALRTLARQGAQGFSMASLSREAHVSRRTLYRYFPNSNAVFEAVSEHVGEVYGRAIDDAVASDPGLHRRIEVVLTATARFGVYYPIARDVFRAEPTFALPYLEARIHQFTAVVRGAIAPSTEQWTVVRSGDVTTWEVAEIVLRLGMSMFAFESDGAERLAQVFAELIDHRPVPVGQDPTKGSGLRRAGQQ
ncbi:TetR/AcrR family transcriptional regulator [Mycobacterium sp. CVI_P3]|uniref:TetR/AcrR family transcriptional regulator n=1 Tax=Mycobacterium pinniadriaticum TaxID=2994102 RepID=A0ABT3SNG2_9MYCO|nr:TetR/AcrR family transcriptional regulator [Mycobacterium pinniadriaticum]MCX2934273.1 TetR/AcrR family transcriptional regulator [Mycobacterium pinniadriaticum]MCX2940689.1 TetR/AcrR family transcriptional regulator [Mycobacterium pinniadriaticum]